MVEVRADEPTLTYLVERYWPDVSEEEFMDATRRIRSSADRMADAGVAVRYRHAMLVPAEESAFCVIDASSSEVVELVLKDAGVPFDRLLVTLDVDADVRTSPGR